MKNLWFPLLAFLLALGTGPILLPILRNLKLRQSIRADGPASHQRKAGTPTMGGLLFLLPTVVLFWLIGGQDPKGLSVLGLILSFGILGFWDDFLKVARRGSLGLRARSKILVGLLLSLLFAYLVQGPLGLGTGTSLPFTHRVWVLGPLFYPFAVLVILGSTNAVNLTDGLDGLAAGTTALALGFWSVVAFRQGDLGLSVLALSLAGGVIGFLFYNLHPARIFMGDTGSLALGAALAGLSLVTGTSLFLLLVGGVFVLEALSVILQVLSFRLTGRRLFRMSPLHHHFELMGLPEGWVVGLFWAAALILTIAGWWALRT